MPTVVSKGQIYTDYLTRVRITLDCCDDGDTLYIGHHSGEGITPFMLHSVSQDDLIELRDALTALIDWNEVEDTNAEEDTDEDCVYGDGASYGRGHAPYNHHQGCHRHQG